MTKHGHKHPKPGSILNPLEATVHIGDQDILFDRINKLREHAEAQNTAQQNSCTKECNYFKKAQTTGRNGKLQRGPKENGYCFALREKVTTGSDCPVDGGPFLPGGERRR